MVSRGELAAHLGIIDEVGDLGPDKVRRCVVRSLVEQNIIIREGEPEPESMVRRFVGRIALVLGHLEGRLPVRDESESTRRVSRCGPSVGVACLDSCILVVVDGRVARRHAEVRAALEDGQVRCLLSDDRDHLHPRRAGADDADPLAGEVDWIVRPLSAVVDASRKRVLANQRGCLCRRKLADGHDQVRRRPGVATVGFHLPPRVRLVEVGRQHSCVQLHVSTQVKAICHVLDVAQDLRLSGVPLAPTPLLL